MAGIQLVYICKSLDERRILRKGYHGEEEGF